MLGSLIIFLKGMRRMMFQLSGFYYKRLSPVYTSSVLDLPPTLLSNRAPCGVARNQGLTSQGALGTSRLCVCCSRQHGVPATLCVHRKVPESQGSVRSKPVIDEEDETDEEGLMRFLVCKL